MRDVCRIPPARLAAWRVVEPLGAPAQPPRLELRLQLEEGTASARSVSLSTELAQARLLLYELKLARASAEDPVAQEETESARLAEFAAAEAD